MNTFAPTLTWDEYQKLPPDQRRRPLTPAEYAALGDQGDAEPGAPADFSGPVFPNPNHIAPKLDTDPAGDPTRLPEGVTLQKQNFTGSMPGDVSNPPRAQISTTGAHTLELPPGATLEAGGGNDMALPPGATLESATTTKPPSTSRRFLDNFLSGVGVTDEKGAKQFFEHPIKTALDSLDAQGDLAVKAKDAYKRGDYMEAVQHGLNYLVPFIGQQTDKAGEQLKEGDYAGGIGRTLGVAAPLAISPEARANVSDAAASAVDKVKNVTPKQAAQATGATTGAVSGHGALSAPGAYYGAKTAGRVAESLLGKERANAPLFKSEPTAAASVPDLTHLNDEFAGETEPPASPTAPVQHGPEVPPAEVLQARALQTGGQPVSDPAAGLGTIPVRTIAKDPATGRPEFSDVIAAKQSATAPSTPAIKPAAVKAALDKSLGNEPVTIKPGVSMRNQGKAAAPLPEGFTPIDNSGALKGYKYDPATERFEAITHNGSHYVHSEVSPETAQKFVDADSKGTAWTDLRNTPGVTYRGKVINGEFVPAKPSTMQSTVTGNVIAKSKAGMQTPRTIVVDPATGRPEFSDVLAAKQSSAQPAAAEDDLTALLQKSLEQAKAAKGGGAETIPGRPGTPRYVYRARDVGEEGVPANNSHAHATESIDEARSYLEGRQAFSGSPQELVRVDVSKLKPEDYVMKDGPNGSRWFRFETAVPEEAISLADQSSDVKAAK